MHFGPGRVRAALRGTIWCPPPENIGVKQNICEGCDFADEPMEGHPNGYRQKKG
jgi:hypothetical protein